jgi:hypothetical protein
MSADAIFDLTEALRARIEGAVGQQTVYVGPPVATDVDTRSVALFLFHIEPNRELRNTPHLAADTNGGPQDVLMPRDALPLDLRYMISVFRRPAGGLDPNELSTLGLVIQVLADEPTFGDAVLAGQNVRVTPEPYPMEEISRVWGLFPTTSYRTSVVYLASPLFITSPPTPGGPPVTERELRSGLSTAAPDVLKSMRSVEVP